MAERPDLEYAVPILSRELVGSVIDGVRVKKPVVLRVGVPGGFEAAVVAKTIQSITRRAHFVIFSLNDEIDMVVAPMLAGRFALVASSDRSTADLAVAFALTKNRELRYRDDVQMGKVYVVPHGEVAQVPGLADIGVDVLDRKRFTKKAFRTLARTRRDQAKVFLMDKTALDAFGNAYADETLFEAQVHPKTWVRSLGDEDLDRLHDAIVRVLTRARDTIVERKPPLDVKLRDFLNVRNREGEPCPRCGTKIRKAGVHGHDAFFCPHCQPETRRSGIVDWRKLEKP
jgi:formamidopyrimidine-DNA glycosylase